MQYEAECRFIWKNWVPKSGQSDNLLGEILRQTECLRWEAQNNGNINWDDDFAFFCDFIERYLCESEHLSADDKKQVTLAVGKMKAAGETARKYADGEITDAELDQDYGMELAYVADDAYNLLNDYTGFLYTKNPEPVKYEVGRVIYR